MSRNRKHKSKPNSSQFSSNQSNQSSMPINVMASPQSSSFSMEGLDFGKLMEKINLTDLKKYLSKNIDENFRPRKYTREQIRRFLAAPDQFERQLREVGQYMSVTNQHWNRIIDYFATMLTLDYILMPIDTPPEKMSDDKFIKNHKRSVDFMEQYNVKHELGQVIKIMMSEGVFYGYERNVGGTTMIQRLPANFCRPTGKIEGNWTFAFNFNFFASQQYGRNIDFYPPEFKEHYATAMGMVGGTSNTNSTYWWQELDSTQAVCFKFDETVLYNIPPMTGIYEEIMDLEDFKDLNKQKTKLDNYKLLIQKIPMKKDPKNERDFLLTLGSVQKFHDGAKSAVPAQVGVISTPMDITDIDFEKANTRDDIVGKAEQNFFTTAGVSSPLFNAGDSGSIGLERSIEVDEAFISKILEMFARFFRRRLAQVNGSSPFQFKTWFPPLTVYNRGEMFKRYLEGAQFGYPKSLVAAALGVQLHDLLSLSHFEESLGLQDVLIPLVSAHTGAMAGDGGAPAKDTKKLTDAGLKTKNANANKNRPKK